MIQFKTIDGLLLRDMAIAGAGLLEKNREAVDALNVFPVPDGDTGTNMSLTMQSAIREINAKEFLRADEAAAALAKGALRGARGNSGVITSQLFRGFSKAVAGMEKITPVQFAAALQKGAEMAYKAVMKPKEGTILTVARVLAEDAVKQAQSAPDDYDGLMNVMLRSGNAILKRTPEMLPALKEAGVVDSGGRGLMLIYTGYASVMRGEDVNETFQREENMLFAGENQEVSDQLTFAYNTEFTIIRIKDDITEGDIDSFRRRLKRIGDHVQVIGDLNKVSVAVHTDHPGSAIEYGLELGELIGLKTENLVEQHRAAEETTPETVQEETKAEKKPASKPYGMVAVSLGDGFSGIFRDLGVESIVEGGQTMNPSIEDICNAIEAVDAETVFVLPNNGNVVLAAQQAAELTEDRKVFVLPTKNVAMGIAAAVSFQAESSPEENAQRMEEAAQHVKTGTVTYAVRDSENNGVSIKQGDYIGLHNGKIAYSGQNIHDVTMEMMRNVVEDGDELITVYYGSDVQPADAEQITADIAAAFPDCDVECHRGGQPLYYYLISVE